MDSKALDTESVAQRNSRTIERFQATFMRDLEEFRSLWAEAPRIRIPFAPPGMPRQYEGVSAFDHFWLPIFEMKGRFDWTTERRIVGKNPDEIVVIARSDVDISASGNPIRYQGRYIQVFDFADGKIAAFTEYIDSYEMGKIYGLV